MLFAVVGLMVGSIILVWVALLAFEFSIWKRADKTGYGIAYEWTGRNGQRSVVRPNLSGRPTLRPCRTIEAG